MTSKTAAITRRCSYRSVASAHRPWQCFLSKRSQTSKLKIDRINHFDALAEDTLRHDAIHARGGRFCVAQEHSKLLIKIPGPSKGISERPQLTIAQFPLAERPERGGIWFLLAYPA
jgi:hypothetical protein